MIDNNPFPHVPGYRPLGFNPPENQEGVQDLTDDDLLEDPQQSPGDLSEFLENNSAVSALMEGVEPPEINEFVPTELLDSPAQFLFFWLPASEIFFGGRTGVGKSFALMAAMLRYVHVPDYKGIVLRKSRIDAKRSSGILARMKSHLKPWLDTGQVRWDGETNTFHWPNGALIEFGYMTAGFDESFQGLEYHQVGIDELTQHSEETYLFWVNRARRTLAQDYLPVRILSTGNPGGIGNDWVKRRFCITNIAQPGQRKVWKGLHPDRIFIQAYPHHNPGLDWKHYRRRQRQLSGVVKAQTVDGDWDANKDARFSPTSFTVRHRRVLADPPSWQLTQGPTPLDIEPIKYEEKERIFHTVDVALSVRTGVAGVDFYESTGRRPVGPSWTVIATWVYKHPWLLLVDLARMQSESPEVTRTIININKRWNKEGAFYIEKNGPGLAVAQHVARAGVNVFPFQTVKDKITNSAEAAELAAQGRVVLPEVAPWLEAFEEELFSWSGHPDQTDDQIDVLSNAAKQVSEYIFEGQISLPTVAGASLDRFTPNPIPPTIGPSLHNPDPFNPHPLQAPMAPLRRHRFTSAGKVEIAPPEAPYGGSGVQGFG